jgi:hypothetical protein
VDRLDIPECMDGRAFLEKIFVPNWGGSPIHGTPMLRRSCLEQVGPFDAAFSMNADVEMWVRLASRWSIAYLPEPLIWLLPRERDHLMFRHYWWEQTTDVRVKRMAFQVLHPKWSLARLGFELRARWFYVRCTLPALRHGRWSQVATGLYVIATGRDQLARPY